MPMSPRTLRPSGGFSPRSIAGLQLWMDATRISSLTFNGSSVSQANDLSGNGRHFTQGTGANQPTYASAGMNGRPALQFTSSVTNLMNSTATIADVIGTPTTSPQSTVFAVMRNVAGAQNACFGSNNDANGRYNYNLRFTATNSFLDIVNSADGRLSPLVSQAESEAAAVHTLFRNGATQTARYNGTQTATKSDATTNFSATTATIQVGKALNLIGGEGVFSELLFWNRALSASEIARVELYLSAKYGVTLG
jgi:hypothetical protein